jgi:hypothetical protein
MLKPGTFHFLDVPLPERRYNPFFQQFYLLLKTLITTYGMYPIAPLRGLPYGDQTPR